ncbi:redoxin domain-containing protein [Rubrobacter marinus]|uniref:Redoxin domain-containing protein n=1 Tax=Rubrobacter marinus TaxID=2653852 RepID=A0A6G8PWL6_9ACTN|nr:redoxin domain-containing protein [Rubrobacter marinus]
MVSYAREYGQFEDRGARIAGISVDPPVHNREMVRKLDLPFALLSDARGELSKLYDLWNDREGVAVPAILVVDRSGTARYVYAGSDFADRPGDEPIFEALDGLEGDAGQPPTPGRRSASPPTRQRPRPSGPRDRR